MNKSSSEHGQTLLLIILAIAGLFGFAALAVDGGHAFAERRRAQSAADAAALAAARKGASSGTQAEIQAAGEYIATQNGFTNDFHNSVIINHPPVSGPYAGDPEYYQALVTTKIDPIFAQFVFSGPQVVTTEAVVMADDAEPASAGNAIFSVNPDKTATGIEFKGNVKVHVSGGNIFSNSNAIKDGNSGKVETTNGGKIYTSAQFTLKGANCGVGEIVEPCSLDGVAQQTYPEVPEPYCPPKDIATNPTKYDNVNYYVWTATRPYPTNLPPGIHCFYNGINLTGNGHGQSELHGTDVLLVLKDGDFKFTGNSVLDLTRANDIIDRNGSQYGGMLIYVPETNIVEECDCKRGPALTFGGTNSSTINGTVYAPNATCNFGGNDRTTSSTYHAAFICKDFKFNGDSEFNIIYKDAENYIFAPNISVKQ